MKNLKPNQTSEAGTLYETQMWCPGFLGSYLIWAYSPHFWVGFHFSETSHLIFPSLTTSLLISLFLWSVSYLFPATQDRKKKKKKNSSLHACIPAHECIPEPGAGGSKDRTTALFSFAGVKEDSHLGCTDFFFFFRVHTRTRIWISKYLPFKEWRLLYFSETRPWGVMHAPEDNLLFWLEMKYITVHSRDIVQGSQQKIIIFLVCRHIR